MLKRKWWAIPIAVLLVLILMAALFWQTLIVYIAPKMVLAGALKDTLDSLERRIDSSPVPILARGIDPDGRNHLKLHLDAYNAFTGSVQYDMDVMLQSSPRRIRADGKARLKNTELDLSLYLDQDFAAVSSDGLLAGQFYGLTYDTFPGDIRGNQLIPLLIGDAVLQNWETKVKMLQNVMGQESLEIPDISGIDLQPMAMGILALDADVERVRINLNGADQTYHVITFETTGGEIASGLAYLNLDMPFAMDADEEVEFSFWLKDRKLGKLEISTDAKKLDIYWGAAPVSFLGENDIYIEYFDGAKFTTCKIVSQPTENNYQETITYVGQKKVIISYNWIPATGDLAVSVDAEGERTDLAVKLAPLEDGFSIATNDFGALIRLLVGTPDNGNHPCTMTVSKGAEFETPAYKNFPDWSAEDLLTLLAGFGSLLGLKLA